MVGEERRLTSKERLPQDFFCLKPAITKGTFFKHALTNRFSPGVLLFSLIIKQVQ
jgi:hypothetical protein